MRRNQALVPQAAETVPERFRDNESLYAAWHEYQQSRLNDTTLRGYSYEVKQYLDALAKPAHEYGQQDLWTYLDHYLQRCRHHRWGGLTGSDAAGKCTKGEDVAACGRGTCPIFEARVKVTVERHLQAVVTLHDFLVRRGLLPYNYARDVKRDYRKENRVQRVSARYLPTTDQVTALLARSPTPNRRIFYAMMAKTGIRIREAIHLRYDAEHFDLAAGWFKIPEFGGKRRGNRLCIIDDELRRHLEAYLNWRRPRARCDALLVNQYGQAWDPDQNRHLRDGVRQDLKRAAIRENVTFHCFRHYFSHHLKVNGIDPYWWNILRGDIPQGNEAVYIHPTPEQIRAQYLRYAPRLGA